MLSVAAGRISTLARRPKKYASNPPFACSCVDPVADSYCYPSRPLGFGHICKHFSEIQVRPLRPDAVTMLGFSSVKMEMERTARHLRRVDICCGAWIGGNKQKSKSVAPIAARFVTPPRLKRGADRAVRYQPSPTSVSRLWTFTMSQTQTEPSGFPQARYFPSRLKLATRLSWVFESQAMRSRGDLPPRSWS